MGRKIPISQLSAAVMEQLTEYAELATEDMKEAVKKAGTTVRKDIEASASEGYWGLCEKLGCENDKGKFQCSSGDGTFPEPVSDRPSAGTWPCEAWRRPGCRKAPYRCSGRSRY